MELSGRRVEFSGGQLPFGSNILYAVDFNMTNLCVGSLWGELLFLLLDRKKRICPLYGYGTSALEV